MTPTLQRRPCQGSEPLGGVSEKEAHHWPLGPKGSLGDRRSWRPGSWEYFGADRSPGGPHSVPGDDAQPFILNMESHRL